MANLGVKVENVLSKFYNVQQDEEIKGLYAVRPISEPNGEIAISVEHDGNTYATTDGRCLKRLGRNSKPC